MKCLDGGGPNGGMSSWRKMKGGLLGGMSSWRNMIGGLIVST